ncbi:ionotropic receptor 75a-like [Daktulosphaira vitifoliae]|uniref:ionotropic receptor 75a-like n=1 Tax=Daktulosphaira vitifoliae TaxID=58002 RepID=UPI0021A9BA55|nr:ionotropic receptor 75a-like [Daktulosphaira vitifoliae]
MYQSSYKLYIYFLSVFLRLATTNIHTKYDLIENFLMKKSIDLVVLCVCWKQNDRVQIMKNLNKNYIAVKFFNTDDFFVNLSEEFMFSDNSLALTIHSPFLGIIFDWSCYKNAEFEFPRNYHWNSSYHWLMIMEKRVSYDISKFLNQKKINLTVDSEVILAYQMELNNTWLIYDIYRTAYEPRGELVIEALNYSSFGKWGNRSWKFDKRRNLRNLTLNAVIPINSYGISANKNATYIKGTEEEIMKYLVSSKRDRLGSVQKFSYATMYPITKVLLNMTMKLVTTVSWGFKINNTWDGLVGSLVNGEADFSMCIAAVRTVRMDVIDYSALSIWTFEPCFIIRRRQSSSNSVNIFLRPFNVYVWISLTIVIVLAAGVYYIIFHFESDTPTFTLKTWSDIILLKIGALCQQGSTMSPTKFSNRLIVLLILIFSMVIYQFYSSSIVSELLRPNLVNIDSIKMLDESGLNVGVEDFNILTAVIQAHIDTNPYLNRIINTKVNPKNEYLLPMEGVKKLKKGNYAFYTDPGTSYFLINDIFTEREKCDLSELLVHVPERTGFFIQKRSPYRELIIHASNILLEVGVIKKEHQYWYAKKPRCIDRNRVTEENLVSVELKDITSIFAFLLSGLLVSFIIFTIEIITHRYEIEKKQFVFRVIH